ncbi:hypothetical protein PENTCL1PPCAC_21972, partial [Pristionchus entomophagus]
MDNHTASQVELAEYLAASTFMHCIIAFRLAVGVLGLFGLSILLRYRSKFIAHSSLVMLLSQHCFWSFIQSLANVIENSILAYQFANYKLEYDRLKSFQETLSRDPATFISFNSGTVCIVRTGWILFSFYGINADLFRHSLEYPGGLTTMFVITIERAVASHRYRSYEKSSSRLGLGLTVVELGIVVGLSYLVIYFYDFDLEYARCSMVTKKGQTFHMIQGTGLILIQFYSTITFYRLLTLNRRKVLGVFYALSERYQLSENVKTLEFSHISLNLIAVALFMLIQMLPWNLSTAQSAVAEESLGFLHLHSVIVPAVIYRRHRSNSSSKQRVLRANQVDPGLRERHIEI